MSKMWILLNRLEYYNLEYNGKFNNGFKGSCAKDMPGPYVTGTDVLEKNPNFLAHAAQNVGSNFPSRHEDVI